MRVPKRYSQIEKAQVLPIVVIGVIVMIAFAALIIDGGAVMLNRRTAQAAADAGALAGARSACLKLDAEAVAEEYARTNGATTATATVSGKTVTVIAAVDHPSFFAKIFNQDSDFASAKAVAGCYPMGAAQVLPLAWSCRNAVGETPNLQSCDVNLLDWTTEMQPLITGYINGAPASTVDIHDYDQNPVSIKMDFSTKIIDKYMYVIMDDLKLEEDIECANPTILPIPQGYLDCDLDNDLVNDILGNQGDRGWLDLDGSLENARDDDTGNGAKTLRNWIHGIGVPTLATHTWLGGQTGVAASIFKAVNDVKGEVALVPIFDALCDVNPEDKLSCIEDVHTMEGYTGADVRPVKTSPGAQNYFHIIRFSAFYIACVDEGGGANKCPGAKQFICDNIKAGVWDDKNATCDANNKITKNNSWIKSIEGYFIKDYVSVGNPGTGDYDVDPLIISLIQ